jgi:predicted ATP-grasp superfamily ATP-dependent carboligase
LLRKYRNPVLIIGGGSGNGLGIARNLGSLGIDVFCFTSNPYELTISSRYCTGFALIPEIEKNKEKLLKALQHFKANLKEKCVLFPTTDMALLTLSSIIDELDSYLTYIPTRKNIEICVIKKNFYKSLQAHGVPYPNTYYPEEEKIEDIIPRISFPVYVRPSISQIFADTFRRKGFIANTQEELEKYIQIAQNHKIEVMVQEIIHGPTKNGYLLRGYCGKNSRIVALMANQKIRQPSMFSIANIVKTIPLSHISKGVQSLTKYFEGIQYQGLFQAEFKRDPRDNVLKLLEINARSAGGNYFGVACGMNHVLLAYLDAIGEDVEPVKDYELDLFGINILKDTPILLSKILHRQISYQDIFMYFRKKYIFKFSEDDVLPYLKDIQGFIREAISENGLQKLTKKLRARNYSFT